MDTPSRSPLERGTAILILLAARQGPVPLDAIAEALAINKSSAFRLIEILQRAHLVAPSASDSGYLLGHAALTIGDAFRRNFAISKVCDASLLRLSQTTGESAGAFVVEFPLRLCISAIESQHVVRRTLRVGQTMPLHLGAVGKVMLANLPEASVAECLRAVDDGFRRGELWVPRAKLEVEIAEARRQGFAVSIDETGPDIWGISVPIVASSLLGALAVTGPMSRFPLSPEHFVYLLRKEAKAIVACL